MAVKAKKKKTYKTNKKTKVFKISEEDIWLLFEKCNGSYAATARAIEKKSNCTYTRQTVFLRISKDPEKAKQIKDQFKGTVVELAESQLVKNIRSDNAMVSQRATEFALERLGIDYKKEQNLNIEDKRQVVKTEIVALPELRKIQDDAKMKRAKEKENNKVH
jgi:hypothetical protein